MNKYEFYSRGDVFNIQWVINKFADVFKIYISSVSIMQQGFTRGRRTNGSLGYLTPTTPE